MITCTFEDGGRAQLRHVVFDALVIEDTRILLVKRSSTAPKEPNKFALPGGYMDRDENLHQGITREVMEETGYHIEDPQLFRIIHRPNRPYEDRQNVAFVFLTGPKEKVGEPDHEVESIFWCHLDDLPLESQIAFDHAESIQLYRQHLTKPIDIPLLS